MPRDATGLMQAFAKYLAIAMAYDDVIRVADLKTRAGRFDRVRREARAGDDQILGHHRILPSADRGNGGALAAAGLGERVERSERLARLIDRGRKLRTTVTVGVPDAVLRGGPAAIPPPHAAARPRDAPSRRMVAARPEIRCERYALATAVCEARRLVGGYSDTHSRGESKFDKVMQASERLAGRPDAAEWVQRLTKVALKDADGTELDGALRTVETLFEDA